MLRRKNKAFTLLESLLTLFIVSFLAVSLSGTVQTAFRSVQEEIFLWEFEAIYKDSQKLAASSHQKVNLAIGGQEVTNGYQAVEVPRNIEVLEGKTITLEEDGGNSSLTKIRFRLSQKIVTYQLYIGSGRYKKTEE
ncbi:TPA: type II secretion system protein [Streptococcus suis]|uniref:Competence type IV pilus minor pilin ComGD n=1 Tax=Streptococcus suis TaxID=1307 RepID=A0AAP6A973_STRSU|nr:competence type IV pilus minor pilin ComGD [Streptococcus suis]MCB2908153.1 type II secretion system protein [Streptococcus suis]MCO0825138.1 type II secretion system GspH family protein [Streptococcus suis]MCO0827401.1 type II secretion system GspH family protein [Streptococcus suis]MCO0847182.1 type II secretion system GspH family protein [Streptococcus suis]MCO0853434.1 type II secretion system GspH family protein [Streptococcus suis]